MKTRKVISIFLLMAMSFSTLHAFAITFLDEDHCSASEYVQEIEQINKQELHGDVCDIHHQFHVTFLLPEPLQITVTESQLTSSPSISEKYTFELQHNLLQPPITRS